MSSQPLLKFEVINTYEDLKRISILQNSKILDLIKKN